MWRAKEKTRRTESRDTGRVITIVNDDDVRRATGWSLGTVVAERENEKKIIQHKNDKHGRHGGWLGGGGNSMCSTDWRLEARRPRYNSEWRVRARPSGVGVEGMTYCGPDEERACERASERTSEPASERTATAVAAVACDRLRPAGTGGDGRAHSLIGGGARRYHNYLCARSLASRYGSDRRTTFGWYSNARACDRVCVTNRGP